MIRIGNQTSFAAASMLDPFEFALANGFTAFEFFPDRGFSGHGGWDERDVHKETCRHIRQTASVRNLKLTVHAPLEINPLRDPEDGRLYSTVEFAAEIGATLVNLHLDVCEGPERFVEALRPALLLTAEAGLQLALENTVFTGAEDFNRFFAALHQTSGFPLEHAGMCLDLGHANLCEPTRNNYLGFVDGLSGHIPIVHLHLHENYGDRDSHLTLFTGPSRDSTAGLEGLITRLTRRRFDGCAIFEQWPQPTSLLVDARNRLCKLLESHR